MFEVSSTKQLKYSLNTAKFKIDIQPAVGQIQDNKTGFQFGLFKLPNPNLR